MIKSLIVSGAAATAAALASPAFAGEFYLNPEFNSAWSGSDHAGSILEGHVGFQTGKFYIQGGPGVLIPDGGDSGIGFTGKAGVSTPLTESIDGYGEVSFSKFDDTDAGYGLKLGAKYVF